MLDTAVRDRPMHSEQFVYISGKSSWNGEPELQGSLFKNGHSRKGLSFLDLGLIIGYMRHALVYIHVIQGGLKNCTLLKCSGRGCKYSRLSPEG